MKKVTAKFQRHHFPDEELPEVSVWDIMVNGRRVSSVVTAMSQDELESHYHPHAVFGRMIEDKLLHDTDLAILDAPTI